MTELQGRIAIVTGASRGIGEATAERFAAAGAMVIAAARTIGDETNPEPDTLSHTVAQIRARGSEAHALAVDLARPESRAAFIDAVLKRFGRVDILINNAGIAGLGARSWDMPDKHFRRVFEVDVFAPRDLMMRVIPGMIERGYGRIVNVSSTVADRAAPNPEGPPFFDFHRRAGVSAYCSAKSALNLFTRAVAAELQGSGVSANIVSPVNSVMTRGTRELMAKGVVKAERVRTPEDPETMAEAILALCAADPATTNGLTTYSGQYLAAIGRAVRGRDGGVFDAGIATESVRY
ncbi:SDR family oxidoreductase [Sphingomonas sp. So64.6b]|uniref:SDR family NAD(P)-dependent oxidoreductase n=1 Tax=Sphingomonas sp. So64.6b TaxID=2997354 RepID=UPI00160257F9|nr:SDR family oxidoreductase [Sphingomonas sp. So64.6b]QNA86605.1 SDR family oxidoreductase [Sphingomonas sp. So64.6b]